MPKTKTKKKTKAPRLLNRLSVSKRGLIALAVLAASAGSFFVYKSFASTALPYEAEVYYNTKFQACDPYPSGRIIKPCWKIVGDYGASGYRAIMLFANGSLYEGSDTLIPKPGASAYRIWAKATACYNPADGSVWPKMKITQVKSSGVAVLETRDVASASKYSAYSTYNASAPLAGMPSISFTNDYANSTCDRNLFIDKVEFIY